MMTELIDRQTTIVRSIELVDSSIKEIEETLRELREARNALQAILETGMYPDCDECEWLEDVLLDHCSEIGDDAIAYALYGKSLEEVHPELFYPIQIEIVK